MASHDSFQLQVDPSDILILYFLFSFKKHLKIAYIYISLSLSIMMFEETVWKRRKSKIQKREGEREPKRK